MLDFLRANLSTIIVAAIVVVIAALAVRKMIKDKKSGKTCSSCGGNCTCCPGCTPTKK